MRIAIVTDATSVGFIFPVWYKYYANQFGGENIFVCTYGSGRDRFSTYPLGKVCVISENYNDDTRRFFISNLCSSLLASYDVVIRVDIDEFLIPEDTSYGSLSDFMSDWNGQYISAKGYDLCELNQDSSLDIQGPIIRNRRYCYPLMPMNKTCITRTPIVWGRGFHYCDKAPHQGGIILLHTKRISIDLQLEWNSHMLSQVGDDVFAKEYYGTEKDNIIQFHNWRSTNKVYQDFDNERSSEFNKRYLESIVYKHDLDRYEGGYELADFLVEIPEDYFKYF